MSRVCVPCFAKVNLTLAVLYRRPDQFHELRTVFQTISLHDRLEIDYRPARRRRIELECAIPIADNLVIRAAHAVLDELRLNAAVRFRLDKRIPMGAGLGGGSSDAAAVLLALPALARRAIGESRLHEIGGGLGSDVPFFLLGGTAVGLGRGEELYPIEGPGTAWAVVLCPPAPVSTPEAYRALGRPALTELTSAEIVNKMKKFQSVVRLMVCPDAGGDWKLFCENDFEAAVFRQYPLLEFLRRKLSATGAQLARMTGSGSALFGVYPTRKEARAAADRLAGSRRDGNGPDIRQEMVSFVSRTRYRSAWRKALQPLVAGRTWPPRHI